MIFINYRIDDSGDVAQRLEDDLAFEFGAQNVFRDQTGIQGGANWPDKIREKVNTCGVMLVLVGRYWQKVQCPSGRWKGYPRLSDPSDWVRQEICTAIDRGCPLIPVLLDRAERPDEEWLDHVQLKQLYSLQTHSLRGNQDYHADLNRLIELIRQHCPGLPPAVQQRAVATPLRTLKESTPIRRPFQVRELDWYDEGDVDHFFGRDDDTRQLRDLLLDNSIVRLFGPSGVGKSSLLRAGLLPALRQLGWRGAVVRPYDQPEIHIPRLIGEQLLSEGSASLVPVLELKTLVDQLRPCCTEQFVPSLVLLIDQVEDIVAPSARREAGDTLIRFLKQIWTSAGSLSPRIRVVLAYRTDAESRLARRWQEISGESSGLPYHVLAALKTTEALRICEDAAGTLEWPGGVNFDELLDQLARESHVGDAAGEVFPPYLQMVLARLASNGEISPVGGVRDWIGEYLHEKLAGLEQRGGDFGRSRQIVETLSRSNGQKISLPLGEIALESRLSVESAGVVIAELVNHRLIRPVGPETYEIQHDRLAEAVVAQMSELDRETKATRELLTAKGRSHLKTGDWLTGSELHLLLGHRERLDLSYEQRRLVLGSLLSGAGDDHNPGWYFIASQPQEIQRQLLGELVRDRDSAVRYAAARALACLGRPEDLDLLNSLADSPEAAGRAEAARALCVVARPNDRELFERLSEYNDAAVRLAAVRALARFRQPGHLMIFRRLAKGRRDSRVREAAIQALIGFCHQEDRGWLRQLCEDREWRVRRGAVRALSRLQNNDDLSTFRKLARDREWDVRHAAILALGQFREDCDLELLKQLADDRHPTVREAVVEALLMFERHDLAPVIRKLARSRELSVRIPAIAGLIASGHWDDLPMLRSQVQRGGIDERVVAVCELAGFRDGKDTELLRELLWHKDSRLRRAATEGLSGYQQIDDLPTFRALLEDRDESVRAAAVRAIVLFRQPDDVSVLRRLTDDHESEVRMAAVEALCNLDERPSLQAWFLASPNRVPRDVAARLDFELFAPSWWREVAPSDAE